MMSYNLEVLRLNVGTHTYMHARVHVPMDTCTYTCKCIIIIICTGADPGFSEGGGQNQEWI